MFAGKFVALAAAFRTFQDNQIQEFPSQEIIGAPLGHLPEALPARKTNFRVEFSLRHAYNHRRHAAAKETRVTKAKFATK